MLRRAHGGGGFFRCRFVGRTLGRCARGGSACRCTAFGIRFARGCQYFRYRHLALIGHHSTFVLRLRPANVSYSAAEVQALAAGSRQHGRYPRQARLVGPAILCTATVYRKDTGGGSGDCDFFHNVPNHCLLPQAWLVNGCRQFSSHHPSFSTCGARRKDQNVHTSSPCSLLPPITGRGGSVIDVSHRGAETGTVDRRI